MSQSIGCDSLSSFTAVFNDGDDEDGEDAAASTTEKRVRRGLAKLPLLETSGDGGVKPSVEEAENTSAMIHV